MPYWRLSAFYFFYFAALGVLVPYWGLYLRSLGFEAAEIGSLMAILMATKIIAPNIWGWLGDHWGRRMLIVRWAAILSLLSFSAMFMVDSFWDIALVMTVYSFFWNASLPQFEAITFNYLGQDSHRYSQIRLWGSIGFIIAVLLVGQWVESYGTRMVLYSLTAVFAAIAFSSLLVADKRTAIMATASLSLRAILQKRPVQVFFIAVFLMQMSHGAYYVFYTLYLQDHGYDKGLIGLLWSAGVLAEVSLFLIMHRWLVAWGAQTILAFSLAMAGLRWLLIGYGVGSVGLLLMAQLLHAFSFGSFHAAAIHLVHRFFQGPHQGKGQALYSSLSFGAGGAVGSFASGLLWDQFSPASVYALSALIAFGAALLVWRTQQA